MNIQKIVFPWKRPLAGVILALAIACIEAGAVELPNPFFAMDTGTQDATHNTPAEQVALVKEIGFAGLGPIYHNAAELHQWLVALDRNRLKMFALYLPLRIDDVPASLASVKETAAALRGRDTLLWLYVTGKRGSRLETNDETVAVQALREISGYGKDAAFGWHCIRTPASPCRASRTPFGWPRKFTVKTLASRSISATG